MSELLEGAERIGAGDYAARVRPSGPRSVRTLGAAFNDMAGRLDASERSRRRFLADVTHELRTPLTVLQAEVEAQLDGIHPRDDAHLQLLREQTAHARPTRRGPAHAGARRRRPADPAPRARCPSTSLVDDAVAAIAATAAAAGVEVGHVGTVVRTSSSTSIRMRIGQVLGNLLTNAVRHTPRSADRSTVACEVRRPTPSIVRVTDTVQVSAADPERVFDRFHARRRLRRHRARA